MPPNLFPTMRVITLAKNLNQRALYSTRPSLLGRYDVFPQDLARVQSGNKILLRDFDSQSKKGRINFDLYLEGGLVMPAEGEKFMGPNGCSLRPPTSPVFQEVVRNFKGRNVTVSVVPKGTRLPPTLTLLHEHTDHYSIQCTAPMKLKDLNKELTDFLTKNTKPMSDKEYTVEYPLKR